MEEKKDLPSIPQNEIRISAKAGVGRYVRYVYNLMEKDEKKYEEVTIKAAGRAIEKAVPLVELLKRRIVGLHQLNKITSTTEKRHDGSDRVIVTLEIILSKNKLEDDGIGYQEPIPEDQVEEYKETMPRDENAEETAPSTRGTRGRGRGRGGRGRGRGTRGRGFRGGRGRGGRGRGGYGYNNYDEGYGYNDEGYGYNDGYGYDDGYNGGYYGGYNEGGYYGEEDYGYDNSYGGKKSTKEQEKPLDKPTRGTRGRGARRGGFRGAARGRGSN